MESQNPTKNFGEISQSTAEILLLPVSENKRSPCCNSTSGFNFHRSLCFFRFSPFTFASRLRHVRFYFRFSACACQTASKLDHQRHSHDVISIFKTAATASQFYFRFSFSVSSFILEGRHLPADQISARYLNPWLIYYYFRFLKTNVRHVEIILPVSIFTFASSSACHSASAYQISSKLDPPLWSHDVITIFKMAAVTISHIEFSQG